MASPDLVNGYGRAMTDRTPLSRLYRGTRERVSALLAEGVDDTLPVPATPGWTVHDVVAHLAGVAQDAVAGRIPTQGPTPAWTSTHVERGAGVPLAELLERWADAAAGLEAALDVSPMWPPVMDAASHEFDLRGALGDTGARDSDAVVICSKVILTGLRPPAPLRVITEHHDVRVGPDVPDQDRVLLRTTSFEAFRWRFGRRSRDQLLAMDWSGDPEPFLPHLCVFGPADHDLVE